MGKASVIGFLAGGVAAGIKKNGGKDIGLIFSPQAASVAGVFTQNRVQAAPVQLARRRVSAGVCQAVVVNAGNANCCTGRQGLEDAMATTAGVAALLDLPEDRVLVASTGVIGQPLPMGRIEKALPDLVASLSPEGFGDLAAAIMTTDRVPKLVARTVVVEGRPVNVIGVAKGAGMIRPDMATMLCFVCTDAEAGPACLQAMLADAVERSFNRITIDGDTSTNDTVLLMANGASGVRIEEGAARRAFRNLLDEMLQTLARALVRDGEGVTKLVEIAVKGAASDSEARRIADTVAGSSLVKTAFFGEDANWGRIVAAAGRAGVPFDPERIDLYFDDVRMVKAGQGCGAGAENDATRVLRQEAFTVTLDLASGPGTASVLTCDFSVEYVKINADYRS